MLGCTELNRFSSSYACFWLVTLASADNNRPSTLLGQVLRVEPILTPALGRGPGLADSSPATLSLEKQMKTAQRMKPS